MNRDGKILLLARIARGIGYGFLSVVLAIYLKLLGFDEVGIGIILTATLVSSAVFTILTSILERRIGRKRLLVLFAALMSLAGGTHNFDELRSSPVRRPDWNDKRDGNRSGSLSLR
jgi:MFS family permease